MRSSFGDRLRDEHGWTPVYVRCNTGRRVSDNGAALAAELDALVRAWPVPVEEVALVGHSMGGLIARSACHVAEQAGPRLGDATAARHQPGTPHLGAPLEKGTNALAHALGRLPETRGLARLLNRRSVGIKDLRFGSVVEDDRRGYDPDEFLRDRWVRGGPGATSSGLHHLDLLTHPKVGRLLGAWPGPDDGSGPHLVQAESAA